MKHLEFLKEDFDIIHIHLLAPFGVPIGVDIERFKPLVINRKKNTIFFLSLLKRWGKMGDVQLRKNIPLGKVVRKFEDIYKKMCKK